MRKIPTLFLRDPVDRRFVVDAVTPGCEWVVEGEGRATRKYDGHAFLLDESGFWWARREIRRGGRAPAQWLPVERDPVTGKALGWEPAGLSGLAAYLQVAVSALRDPLPGTYELIGPGINRNPERADRHLLVAHAAAEVVDAPRDFANLGPWLRSRQYEGVVWHRADADDRPGEMAKIKRRDLRA